MPHSFTAFMAISLRRDSLTTFLQSRRQDRGLVLLLKLQLLEPPVLFFKFFNTGHHLDWKRCKSCLDSEA
jgi:hypothetical protein